MIADVCTLFDHLCDHSSSGLVGLGRQGNGDMFETQLKLSSQKWKARCKISRQQQMWQDEDVSVCVCVCVCV